MQERTIQLEDKKISYLDSEMGEKVLLLLHGNSLSKDIFTSFFDSSLASEFRLIAPDFPGHGESDQAPSYSVPGLAKIVLDFCQALKIENPRIVGHSLGGHVGIHVATQMNVAQLILMGTPLIDKLETFGLAYKDARALELFGKSALTDDEAGELSVRSGVVQGAKIVQRVDRKFRQSLIDSLVAAGDPGEASMWHALTCKKKIILGNDDTLVNLDLVLEAAAHDEVMVVEQPFGHTPFVSNPAKTTELLSGFLN